MVIKDLKKIRIAFLSTIYHTSFPLMFNNTVEKSLNIKTEWELHGTGPSIIKKFLHGELEIGYIGLPPTIIGIDKRANIKCIAGGHVEGTIMVAFDHYKSLKEVNNRIIDFFNQFKNKSIGVPKRGSIHDVMLRDCIKKAGLRDKIKIKNYDITDFILSDMENYIVDAAVGTPALPVFLNQYLKTKIVIPTKIWWPYNPSYGIVVSDFLIENYPEVVESFIELHKDACTSLRKNPRGIAKIVEKEVEFINLDFILNTYRISPKYCAALPPEYINSTMEFVSVLQKLGYIERKLKESEIFDLSFIEKVHPENHHYENGIAT
ncbi:MAG: ABC transporter substrate-binding protein [Candidatus Helarchaeota archaeon]|nr:ABC transporter substrate-binding protein [Candidatus Helarchaeota archaeon]